VRQPPGALKAAVNAPQSKRFAKCQAIRQSRQRLDCGGFSTARAAGTAEGRKPTTRALYFWMDDNLRASASLR